MEDAGTMPLKTNSGTADDRAPRRQVAEGNRSAVAPAPTRRRRTVAVLGLVALAVSVVGVAVAGVAVVAALTATQGPVNSIETAPPANPAAANRLEILPASTTVAVGTTFTVRVSQTTVVPTSGAQATLGFDPSLLSIVTVGRGQDYGDAPIIVPSEFVEAINTANSTGSLKSVAMAFMPPSMLPAGTTDFLTVQFKAIKCGTARLDLPVGPVDATMIDGRADRYGSTLQLGTVGGSVRITC